MKYLAPLAGFTLALLIGGSFIYTQAHTVEEHSAITNNDYCDLEKYPSHKDDNACIDLVEIPVVIHNETNQETNKVPPQTHQVVKVHSTNNEICGN